MGITLPGAFHAELFKTFSAFCFRKFVLKGLYSKPVTQPK